jgi:hypothetical protein
MPVIPIPSGRNGVRLAGLLIVLIAIVLLSPALLVCWTFPAGRDFVLQLLSELRTWTSAILGSGQDEQPTPLPIKSGKKASRTDDPSRPIAHDGYRGLMPVLSSTRGY